jgi:hypothetical protein
MRRLVRSVPLAAAILVTGCLVTVGVQAASGTVVTSSPRATAPPTASAPPSPTLAPPSPTPSIASPPAAPSTVAPTPATPPGTSPATSSGSGADLIWLWIILAALVLLGIILWATRSPARSSAAANWRARAAEAYAQGGAFDGAVRAAERQGAFTDGAGARWYDIDRHADDLTQTLYAMRETAPTEERRAQVGEALAALQAVRHAASARWTPGAGAQPGANLHARLLDLESALNALRVPEEGRL